jgi:hypothetical protein
MAIAFVKNIASTTTSNVTTATLTIPASGVALGNTIALRWKTGTDETVSSIVDTQGNTYTVWVAEYLVSDEMVEYRCNVGTALVSGNTIVVTFSNKADCMIVADEFSGVSTTEDAEDTGKTGTSTTPSASAVIANADTLCVASLLVIAGSADSFTEDADATGGASWNSMTTVVRAPDILRGAYKIATSAATQTYNPTLGTSREWQVQLGSLKATAVVTPPPPLIAPSQAAQRAASW